MAKEASQRQSIPCSGCGSSNQRLMLSLSVWTWSQGWHQQWRYCWACAYKLMRLRDAVQWAERQ